MSEPANVYRLATDASVHEAEQAAALEVARARRALPPRDEAIFDCRLGHTVNLMHEHTEADPLAILVTLLSFVGARLGPGPHLRAGDDRHPLLVWPLIIGRTGGGRKGASWGSARRLLAAADPTFATDNLRSGLTSGEGLAALFADSGSDEPEPGRVPPGDRRLLVFEAEWAAVMQRMRREGNSLPALLRAAWEGGDLSTLTVNPRHAPESHMALVAHITPEEFASKVSASDLAGGTYNRFLPIYVARSRFLPFATGMDNHTLDELGAELADRMDAASRFTTLGFAADGAQAWRSLYVEFGADNGDNGPIEQFVSRAAPYCLRVAAIHAVLDGTSTIGATHLHAAAALIRYAIASARAVFTTADPDLPRLAEWIGQAGPQGRTKEEIRSDFFARHKTAQQINTLLDQLTQAGDITPGTRPRADGRPGRGAQIYTSTPGTVSTVAPPPA